MQTEAYYLVIDLEATCDDGGRMPPRDMETIEVGAVLVDGEMLLPVAEFQSFVRPVKRPTLTPFCTRLTSIRQSDVVSAPLFPEVMHRLGEFLAGEPALFCSWGRYDKNQLDQDARHHRIALPLGNGHLNLKQAYAEQLGVRPMGMAGALRHVGLPLVGTHHRGIDDARNIARLLAWSLGRGAEQAPR